MYCYYMNSTDTVPMLPLLLFSLSVVLQFQAKTVALPSSNCRNRCGDVDIVYPFGIGAGCAMEGFELNCSITDDGSSIVTIFDKIPVLNISVLDGNFRIMKHISTMYSLSRSKVDYDYWWQDLSNTPFTYSGKSNMLTVIGVNTIAYLADDKYVIGCVSKCSPYNHLTAQDGMCSGAGCCRAALTSDMFSDYVSFDPLYNTTRYYTNTTRYYTNRNTTGRADYRGYAVIIETKAFHFNIMYLNTTTFLDKHTGHRVPAILNWVVGNETCDVATKKNHSYACLSINSVCVNSSSGSGYLCNCTKGYQGNPYLPGAGGCQDIDECAGNTSPCAGCVNTLGSFFCPPPRTLNVVALAVGTSIGVVVVVIAITCACLIQERKKLTKIKRKYFRQHGGMLLLQEMRLKQGTDFSIFTEAELNEATDKFDDKNIIGRGGHGTVYKGTLKEGNLIAVKRCVSMIGEHQKEEFGKEMLILSQINHKNIVKLLGCCLEVEVPMLVYEFIPNGTLFEFIHVDNGSRGIHFSTRMHIACESARALAYLHSWASPPIIHGDVKSSNILLDENYAAKVSDFGASILARTGESQFVTHVQGTYGYLDPEYMQTFQLTDKSDVYSFGVVLLELLTSKKALNLEGHENERSLSTRFLSALKEDRLMDVIDDRIKNNNDIVLLEDVAELARQCLELTGEKRPAMRDVAEKLERLGKVMQHPCGPKHDPEETESLLGESLVSSFENTSTRNFSKEKRIVQGLLGSGR